MKKYKEKRVVIFTGLPFRRQGNQSLIRFVNMFLDKGLLLTMFSAGNDERGENALEHDNFTLCKIKSFEISFSNFLNKIFGKFQKRTISTKNHFKNIKSYDVLPPYGSYTLANSFNKWFKYILTIIDNILMFFYILLFKNAIIRDCDLIIAYEINYSLCSKWFSKIYKKKYINKFQGTILKAIDRDKKKAIRYFPHNYYGINSSDLCLMVQDGTDGKYYAHERGCKNIFFEPHGVYEYKEDTMKEKNVRKLVNINKFILFNNASGSTWKRPDRIIRALLKVKKKVLDNIILYTTYHASDRDKLIAFVKDTGLEKKVIFLEKIDNYESNYILRNSDVLIMTNDFSNLGNPILEAIYYKIPIISINDGSLDGFLEDERDSFLIDLDKDFDINMAHAIERLYEDKGLYSRIKQNLNSNNQVRELSIQQEREFKVINTLLND
jgi:L-malate glycosyltransferase